MQCNFWIDITRDKLNDEWINPNVLSREVLAEKEFSILVNFDKDLEESIETWDPQLHQSQIDKNQLHEECTVKYIS